MKHQFSRFFAMLCCISAFGGAPALKVLMVGNSYSLSCKAYLRKVAASAHCPLELEIAYIGGCSLQRHVEEYDHSEKDPNHRPYRSLQNAKVSLQELLTQKKWDLISIQQASPLSWRAGSYHPWADQLIAIIRKTNPQAEIVIQETWSYNGGDPRFAQSCSQWTVNQKTMFEELEKNYRNLAKEYRLRIIPMGLAVDLSRKNSPLQLPTCDAKTLASLAYPDNLPETLDVVGECHWAKGKDGKPHASADTIHLNDYGKYLQACVWFGFLFRKPVSEISFYPEKLERTRLDQLREIAQQALDQQREYEKRENVISGQPAPKNASVKTTAEASPRIDDLGMTPGIFLNGGAELPYRQAILGKDQPGKFALLIFLHGAGERGNDNRKQLINNFPDIMAYCRSRGLKIVVLAPQCPEGCRWVEVDWSQKAHDIPKEPSRPMGLLMKLLDAKCAEFDIDPGRIYLTGISMGGYGSWDLLCRRPKTFAAALILCGGADEKEAPKLIDIPIRFYHGFKDTIVPVSRARNMAAALQQAGGKKFEYREIEAGHFIWIPVYRDPQNFDWLFSQTKKTQLSHNFKD